MPNPTAGFGFVPINVSDSRPNINVVARWSIASGYGTTLVRGMAVQPAGAANATDFSYTNVVQAAGADQTYPVGVIESFSYIDASGKAFDHVHIWPASTTLKTGTVCVVNLYDNPDQRFLILGDSGAWAATHANQNCAFAPGTPSGTKATSTATFSSVNTTTTLPLKILGFAEPNLLGYAGDALGAYAGLIVRFNSHFCRVGAGVS